LTQDQIEAMRGHYNPIAIIDQDEDPQLSHKKFIDVL